MEVTKKLTLEEILQAIEGLSEEEKAQVVEKAQVAQQEQKTDEIPEEAPEEKQVEEKTEEPPVVPTEKTEDVEMEEKKEEIPEETSDPIPETPEEKPTEDTIPQPTPEKEAEAKLPEEPTKEPVSPTNDVEKNNQAEMVKALTDRVTALEEANKTLSSALEEFKELKALMEEYTSKQADSFGYKGQIPGAKKDIKDMSADELKSHILQGK